MEFELTEDDYDLIKKAEEAIGKGYRKDWHTIGSALKTKDGEIFTSINFNANIGRIDVCAEPIALANAVMAGKEQFDTIVAVRHPKPEKGRMDFQVVSPCGMCREIVTDYDPETKVIINVDGELKKMNMIDLLPHKFE